MRNANPLGGKIMKKLLALILALACMLTVFTACGGGEAEAGGPLL